MPTKRLIDARRMRKGLPRGFGWIDHRLLQEGYITNCTPQALALYVLLVCASDAQGLAIAPAHASQSCCVWSRKSSQERAGN